MHFPLSCFGILDEAAILLDDRHRTAGEGLASKWRQYDRAGHTHSLAQIANIGFGLKLA